MEKFLYLEPHTFIFRDDAEVVVYNSLNGLYNAIIKPSYIIKQAFEYLEKPENGYCIELDSNYSSDPSLLAFIDRIIDSNSGGICFAETKPFIIAPACKIYDSIDRLRKENGVYNGRKVIRNLNEVEIYLSPKDNKYGCEYSSYKQFLSNHSFDTYSYMTAETYLRLLMHLSIFRIPKVNFLNSATCTFLPDVLNLLNKYSFKKTFYLSDIDELVLFDGYDISDTSFIINITDKHTSMDYKNAIQSNNGERITFRKMISSIDDFEIAESLLETLSGHIELVPLYTGSNLDFFKEYVFNSLDDILRQKSTKLDIHRRQNINEHFFGKLYILPNGDTYSNLNYSLIGNIMTNSMTELVYTQMDHSSCWFLTRDKVMACRQCVNKTICPSISNYELITCIPNMCYKYES
ncbi:MAG: TIGR04150 pseudo-rSAM protein [Bacteroides sp.]|nr:TIGR04150 pseudo-rSAM protein [Bacteroides sp.]